MKGVPAWKLLVDNGLFPSRDLAERWILAGKVLAGDNRIDKPGQLVPADARIRIKDHCRRFIGRGGLKLEHALSVFDLPVTGRAVLDCGASTGGFTDCLLQRGASVVYAVDAGYGQLAGRLRADPRVVNMERTNLGDQRLQELLPRPTIVTLDLSYLSLRIALPLAAGILQGTGQVVALVKPLFEVDDAQIRRTGIIRQRSTYTSVLLGLVEYCASSGYPVRGVTHSPIRGSRGTEEYLICVDLCREGGPAADDSGTIAREIEAAVKHWERAESFQARRGD